MCCNAITPHAGFTAPQAVALSNITILGGSLANFIANSSKRHPSLDRPLIYWDLILVMEPTTMLGALLGGYLNKVRLLNTLTGCLSKQTKMSALAAHLNHTLHLVVTQTLRKGSSSLLLVYLSCQLVSMILRRSCLCASSWPVTSCLGPSVVAVSSHDKFRILQSLNHHHLHASQASCLNA